MAKPEFIPKFKELEFLVSPKIQKACGPLFFTTSLTKAKGNVVDSGSYGLVCTGQKMLLVTCYHVWNDFLAGREKNPELKLCVCFGEQNPFVFCTLKDGTKTRLIDQNKELDIATFDMEPFRAACEKDISFFIPNCGSVSALKEQDAVAIIGFPGKYRDDADEGIYFTREPYIGFASSISGYKMMVDFTTMMSPDRELTVKQDDKKPATSGVSGGPCFVVRPDYEPYLVGFVTDHLKFSESNFVQLTTSNCINDDGTLKSASSFFGS